MVLLLLSALLGGCSVYDHFAHPHRLGTPPMTSSARAKARAAENARHKGLTLGSPDAAATPPAGSADAAAPPPADTRSTEDRNKAVAEMLGNTYDKNGHLKRSKLQKMQYSARALHHYDLRPSTHNKATRDERKLRHYTRDPKEKAAADEPAPARASKREPQPASDPTQPAPTPAAAKPPVATPAAPAAAEPAADTPDELPLAPRSKPGKFQTEKKSKKKDRKAPKPDPTQPEGGNQ